MRIISESAKNAAGIISRQGNYFSKEENWSTVQSAIDSETATLRERVQELERERDRLRHGLEVITEADPDDEARWCTDTASYYLGDTQSEEKQIDSTKEQMQEVFQAAPELKICIPLVLFFPTRQDADEFIEAFNAVKPNVKTISLPPSTKGSQ